MLEPSVATLEGPETFIENIKQQKHVLKFLFWFDVCIAHQDSDRAEYDFTGLDFDNPCLKVFQQLTLKHLCAQLFKS